MDSYTIIILAIVLFDMFLSAFSVFECDSILQVLSFIFLVLSIIFGVLIVGGIIVF